MELIRQILSDTTINAGSISSRLLISLLIGIAIGTEREMHNQPAGLRTHVLICLGSTILMLLSIYIPQTYTNFPNGDPARLAAQVVSGIGFLGAGAILKMGVNIRGLTTAATIWATAAIGLTVGAGMYLASFLGMFIMLFILILLNAFEKRFLKPSERKVISISGPQRMDANIFTEIFREERILIISRNMEEDRNKNISEFSFAVQLPHHIDLTRVVGKLADAGNAYRIKVSDK
jgi:putative Mg2+ transporter-C (MgtC) family protein